MRRAQESGPSAKGLFGNFSKRRSRDVSSSQLSCAARIRGGGKAADLYRKIILAAEILTQQFNP